MNPTSAFWWDLFGRLFIESSILMGLAAVAARKMSPQQQRKVWQIALSLLLPLFFVEATGLHRRIHFPSAQAQPAPGSRRLTIQIMPVRSAPEARGHATVAKRSSSTWVPGFIWVLVFSGFVGRSFGARLLFIACKRARRPVDDPALGEIVDALAAKMRLGGRIHLSESRSLAGPIAFGFVSRRVCVPTEFCRRTESEKEVMLAHELAHLALRDPFWYAVVDFAAALFWLNPLVWLGRRQFQAACEGAADEASLLVDNGAPTLARCLLELGKRLAGGSSYGWIGIAGRRSALWQRVDRLLKLDAKPCGVSRRWTAASHFVGTLMLFGTLATSAGFGSSGPSLAECLWYITLAQVPQPMPSLDWKRIGPTNSVLSRERNPTNGTLYTRFFRVPKFEKPLKDFAAKRGRDPDEPLVDQVKFLLEENGVNSGPPSEVFYNSRIGMVVVRATLKDLAEIEQILVALNAAPADLQIETKFVELSDPLDSLELRNFAIGGDQNGTNGFRGILPPSRYRDLVKWLEGRAGVDILSAPSVTTLSGRQAQIKVVEVKTVVTDLDFSDGQSHAPKPIAERSELGPVLDVVPLVREDGVSIEITVISTIREFLGYDLSRRYFDSGPPRPITPAPIREYLREKDSAASSMPPGEPLIPLPTFRIR